MKKSQLRKMIKESIKELMNEQLSGPSVPVQGWNPSMGGTGQCVVSAWSNYSNWHYSFVANVKQLHKNAGYPGSGGPGIPGAATQPCQFLNNKIAQFSGNLAGTGQGGYQNIQGCKLNLVTSLHNHYNC